MNSSYSDKKQKVNTKYKTILCKNFGNEGVCSFGNNCKFAHGLHELQTQLHVRK